jgi:hypothetical protein
MAEPIRCKKYCRGFMNPVRFGATYAPWRGTEYDEKIDGHRVLMDCAGSSSYWRQRMNPILTFSKGKQLSTSLLFLFLEIADRTIY